MTRRSSRTEKNGAADRSETREEELNWAMGLARWTAFESKHGSGIVPGEDPDQQLVRWTKKQRKDYWNWKKGRPAYLGEESFQMLTRFGFHWGEDEDSAVEGDDEPSSETAAKPAAEQTKTQPIKRKREESSETAPPENVASEKQIPSSRDSRKKTGPESSEAIPLDNIASEQPPSSRDSRKKKAATRSKRSEDPKPEEPTHDGELTDTDAEGESASKVTKNLRRSTRQVSLPPPFEVYDESSKPAATKPTGTRKRKTPQAVPPSSAALKRRKLPTREVSRKQAPKASKAGAKAKSSKAKGKASGEQSKAPGFKTLKRVISPEEEEDVPAQIRKEFADILTCDELLEPDKDAGVNIQTARFNQHWEDNFFQLLVFVKTYGHTLVPKVYNENKALGRFVAKMRNWFKSDDPHLTPSRQKRLEAIDFSWDAKTDPNFWRVQNDTPEASELWEERFEELLAYKKANGDCMVPKNYPPNQTLARWVSKQRRHFRAKEEGTYHTLDDEKVAKLVEADFVFETKTHSMIRETVLKRFEGRWDYFFDLLVAFKKLHGHCAVPRRWKPDQPLASWVMRQRFQWKKMQEGSHSYLTEERLERLKDIAFVFQVDRKTVYPIDGTGSVKSSPAAATKSTGRRAKASTPASVLTIEADEESASSKKENSDGELEKAIPQDAVDSDGEDDGPTASVPEEDEQTEVQEEKSPGASEKGDGDTEVLEEEEEKPEEESPGASEKGNGDGELVGEKQATDEEGDIVVSDSETAKEAKAHEEEGSLGAPERRDAIGKTVEKSKTPDKKGSLGASAKSDSNGGTSSVEKKKTTDGVDALFLFAGESRDGNDDTVEEKTKTDEAEALLILGTEKGGNGGARSAVDAATPGDSTPAAASKKSKNRRTKGKATGGTREETVSEEKHDSDAAGVVLSTDERPEKGAPSKAEINLNKGVWTCSVCEEDDFQYFIDATAHEAACADLAKLAIPIDTQLD